MSGRPILLWYRNDLRVGDHRALCAAVSSERPVIPVYVWDADPGERIENARAPGSAGRWWLHHSLVELDNSLRTRGSALVVRKGAGVETLRELAATTNASGVYFSRGYEPAQATEESELHKAGQSDGFEVRRFAGTLLREPESVRTQADDPYKVFTPYYKACLDKGTPAEPAAAPEDIPAPDAWPDGLDISKLDLLPRNPDWSAGWLNIWSPGEAGAHERLEAFLHDHVRAYDEKRNRPDLPGTSGLSPFLRWGNISPAQIWHSTMARVRDHGGSIDQGTKTFLQEIIWREFSYHLLVHFPHITHSAFKPEFDAFPWDEDSDALKAWQRGQTGYPIVDAGMRQLWQTGWMHNRVRMIVASFLIKHLLQPWQAGEAWFWDTLVDGDLASNTAGWQWVAGSGADASPYFRIFNPITQGEKFDPKGDYIRRWVPEVAGLPDKYVNRPWEAPSDLLARHDIRLGETYPEPLVDHSSARQRALDAYDVVKEEKKKAA